MDKYSKILIIENGDYILTKIREKGYSNSSNITSRILRDEISTIDYISQFTPDVIIIDNLNEEVIKWVGMARDIVDARLIEAYLVDELL